MDELPSPRLVDAVWRYRVSSAIIVGVAVLLSVLVALVAGESSRMQARLALKPPDKAGVLGVEAAGETAFARYVNQRALFVTSDQVLSGAAKKLAGAVSKETLRSAVTAEASETGESVVLLVAANNPDEASKITQAVIEAYREASRGEVEQRVADLLETLAEQRSNIETDLADTPENQRSANTEAAAQSLSELDNRSTELRVAASQIGDGVAFVYDTEPDRTALLRSVARDGVIGLGLGGVLALAAAWFRADRDRRVGNLAELESLVDDPVLGEIEQVGKDEAATLLWLGAPPSKTYRMVAFGLQRVVDHGVVIVTGESGSGTTTTTIQLASALARGGLRVLLVDGAVRSHGLSTSIGLAANRPNGQQDTRRHPGLTDIAMGSMPARETMRVVELGDGVTLTVVPAGRYVDGVLERFSVPLLDQAIAEMRSEFDIVLVDSPTPASAPEAGAIVRASDAVIIVVRRDADAAGLHRLSDQVRMVGGKVAGYVLTFAARRT